MTRNGELINPAIWNAFCSLVAESKIYYPELLEQSLEFDWGIYFDFWVAGLTAKFSLAGQVCV